MHTTQTRHDIAKHGIKTKYNAMDRFALRRCRYASYDDDDDDDDDKDVIITITITKMLV